MPGTGVPDCPACRTGDAFCPRCGGSAGRAMAGAASLRGGLWAARVVAQLVRRWPARWPRTPRALELAARQVDDLARGREQLSAYLVDVCMKAAAERYEEMLDYLLGKRLNLPPGPTWNEEDWPK